MFNEKRIMTLPTLLFTTTFYLATFTGAQETASLNYTYASSVKTTLGYVRGKTVNLPTGKSIDSYLGIPYGAPPVGKYRFRYPRPASPWNGVLDTVEFSKSCVQNPNRLMKLLPGGHRLLPKTPFSEDCLYLNVWVPRPKPNKAAVMVFIHGGGFSLGSTSTPGYAGDILASEEDILVVSFNYRVASLGFLYFNHEDIDANAALFDQVLALKWVRNNIEAFGGDPEKVTLFGQSAGAASIGYHMMSPVSRDLFKRAILESGSPLADWSVKTKEYIEYLSYTVASFSGCLGDNTPNLKKTIECLRGLPAEELIANEPIKGFDVFTFWPVIDGKLITEYPIKSYTKGEFKKTELLVGSTRNEGTGFMVLAVPHTYVPTRYNVPGKHKDLVEAIKYHFPNESEVTRKVIEFEYTNWKDVDDSDGVLSSGERMIGDYFFACGVNKMAKIFSHHNQDVYQYFFTHRSPSVEWRQWWGTPHTEELRYVFGDVFDKDSNFTQEDQSFARRVMRYWANFARTGNPNLSPSTRKATDQRIPEVEWPKFSKENEEYLVLSPKSRAVGLRLKQKKCAFWDQLMPYLKGNQPPKGNIL